MGLLNMTVRRIRKVLAWVFAIVILALLGAGAVWTVEALGWLG